MDSLPKIFQSNNGEIRLRVLRFFLANDEDTFSVDEIVEKTKVRKTNLRKELSFLFNAGFLEKFIDSRGAGSFRFDANFEYKNTLFDLVFDFKSINKKIILDKFKQIGRIKLFSFSGVFTDDLDTEVDILVVGDNLKQKEINRVVMDLNSLFASKLRLLIMDIEEFDYRKKMFDRFLHMVLDGKRITPIDKLGDNF
jgi:predicted transcriptional regulator